MSYYLGPLTFKMFLVPILNGTTLIIFCGREWVVQSLSLSPSDSHIIIYPSSTDSDIDSDVYIAAGIQLFDLKMACQTPKYIIKYNLGPEIYCPYYVVLIRKVSSFWKLKLHWKYCLGQEVLSLIYSVLPPNQWPWHRLSDWLAMGLVQLQFHLVLMYVYALP